MGRVHAFIKSCWVGLQREHARDVTIMTIGIPGIWNSRISGIPVSLDILCKWSPLLNPSVSLSDRWGLCVELYIDFWPIMVRDIPVSLVVSFGSFLGLFVLHWRYELPCQDKLPEFHYTPILGFIRVLVLVFHLLGLGLDKALFGWNSVKEYMSPRQDFSTGI